MTDKIPPDNPFEVKNSAKELLKKKIDYIFRIAGDKNLQTEFESLGISIEDIANSSKELELKFPLFFDFFYKPSEHSEYRFPSNNYKYAKTQNGLNLGFNLSSLTYVIYREFETKFNLFTKNKLRNYKPNKTNKEKFEAKQQLKSAIRGKFDNSNLNLTLENLESMTDSSLQLIEDVVQLPLDQREKAYRIGEERVLSVFNPPGKSMGASGY